MFDFEMPSLEWRVCTIPKPKKPGEYRKITIPNDDLKAVQRRILQYLYSVKSIRISEHAHGFLPKRDTISGVREHDKGADLILCLDLKDFFDTFPLAPIAVRLKSAGLDRNLVDKILEACSYKGAIPQGGPCSPFLTNVGMYDVDNILASMAKRNGFTYTRYADDITYSTTFAKPDDDIGVRRIKEKKSYKFMFSETERILSTVLGVAINHKKDHGIRKTAMVKRRVLGIAIRKDEHGYDAPMEMRMKVRSMVCNLAREIMTLAGTGAKPTQQHRMRWRQILGNVQYMDRLRAYNDAGYKHADPCIQEKYWKVLVSTFGLKGKNKCPRQ